MLYQDTPRHLRRDLQIGVGMGNERCLREEGEAAATARYMHREVIRCFHEVECGLEYPAAGDYDLHR